MSEHPHQWAHPLLGGICDNPFNSLYATCFPCCAISSAKSHFDGSDWCFNFCCFSSNLCLVRSYIRQGYRIRGDIGVSDFCVPSIILCYPCVITQLLNEVGTRGPKIFSQFTLEDSPWTSTPRETSCFKDPCDILFTPMTSYFENASAYSLLSGSPFWFGCPLNICQLSHIVRKSYGIGGNDCVGDCLLPSCCLCVPIYGCIYYHRLISQIKGEIWKRKQAPNFGYPYEWTEEDDEFSDLPLLPSSPHSQDEKADSTTKSPTHPHSHPHSQNTSKATPNLPTRKNQPNNKNNQKKQNNSKDKPSRRINEEDEAAEEDDEDEKGSEDEESEEEGEGEEDSEEEEADDEDEDHEEETQGRGKTKGKAVENVRVRSLPPAKNSTTKSQSSSSTFSSPKYHQNQSQQPHREGKKSIGNMEENGRKRVDKTILSEEEEETPSRSFFSLFTRSPSTPQPPSKSKTSTSRSSSPNKQSKGKFDPSKQNRLKNI